jgi:hypothetical protein
MRNLFLETMLFPCAIHGVLLGMDVSTLNLLGVRNNANEKLYRNRSALPPVSTVLSRFGGANVWEGLAGVQGCTKF